ncbi:methyl-accepting chemotaxis protein [Lichenihabitans sp. Uapishka_5]|uniref:methyl-accepting chemotaxis protein n=1 Tax=Lichenihabitans sp. Uapishka_5 TaxID=3037302 RepID=UPI0029E82159|nr:methyl-accepting chemotaxis protein [Lichenihabitans sp. Uapishka_5]MDX7952172.1 methyl-accepting chemotaxis protein [Lichenihabitans sp. Uapishka_5]
MKNIRVSNKIIIGFTLVMMSVAITNSMVYFAVRSASTSSVNNSVSNKLLNEVDNALDSASTSIGDERGYLLLHEPRFIEAYKAHITAFDNAIATARKRAVDYTKSADVLALLNGFNEAFKSWQHEVTDVLISNPIDDAGHQNSLALIKSERSIALRQAFETKATDLKRVFTDWSDADHRVENDALAALRMIQAVGFGIALVVSAVIAWFLSRALARPLSRMTATMVDLASGNLQVEVPTVSRTDEIGQMAAALQTFKSAAIEKTCIEADAMHARRRADEERYLSEKAQTESAKVQAHVVTALAEGLAKLAQGDLVHRIHDQFAPEYDKLKVDFNAAMGQLQNTMRAVSANTAAIRVGTREISTAADDLSRRTEQQAASLEETAAALDEITATVRKTAEGATHARVVVSTAKSDAEQSSLVVGRAVEAMAGIETSSQQIGQIIGVIDKIAFQTNLLALNAGVEAARAGEAGRGFAVVASEVRALAQRSAEAAKEIKALIAASAQHVGSGVELVGETGKSLQRIMVQVTEINAVVTVIAASAQEQSTGLDQVNTAINQMDQVTQQNAAMVEQSTAASKSLAQETEELADLVGRFRVEGGSAGGMARRPIAKPTPVALRSSVKAVTAPQRAAPTRKLVANGASVATGGADEWQEF